MYVPKLIADFRLHIIYSRRNIFSYNLVFIHQPPIFYKRPLLDSFYTYFSLKFFVRKRRRCYVFAVIAIAFKVTDLLYYNGM